MLQEHVSSEYDFACEHKHSNCVLLAHIKFKIEGEWHTFIDYERFHACMDKYNKTGEKFDSMDYMEKTPAWAVYGAQEGGFDPVEVKHERNKTNGKVPKVYSGC